MKGLINILKIKLICVGKLGKKYLQYGVNEYEKRLRKYVKFKIDEVKDEQVPKKYNYEEVKKVQIDEQKRIREKIEDRALVIILDQEGRQLSSEKFATKIKEIENKGISKINFIIGGTLGFSSEFKNNADTLLSFSKMTFPHQLMRLLLLEQIYRAFKINRGEPYHR